MTLQIKIIARMTTTRVEYTDGAEMKNVKNLSVYKELESRIQFKGTVDNVQDYLNDSDIYVHSAIHESFGLVLLEAMAARLPVISIDGKGNRDVVLNGKNGYLINDQNVEEFGEKTLVLKFAKLRRI